jgi:hypothetical protein
MLGWVRCSFHKKRAGTHNAELVFLPPAVSVGHVVRPVKSVVWFSLKAHRDMLCQTCIFATAGIYGSHGAFPWMHYFSCSGEPGAVSIKSAPGHIMSILYFCLRWDLRVTYCIPVHPGRETSTHYISWSRVSSSYCIYIFPWEEGFLSCIRLTLGVTPMSTTTLYRCYVNWG